MIWFPTISQRWLTNFSCHCEVIDLNKWYICFMILIGVQIVPSLANENLFKLAPRYLWCDPCTPGLNSEEWLLRLHMFSLFFSSAGLYAQMLPVDTDISDQGHHCHWGLQQNVRGWCSQAFSQPSLSQLLWLPFVLGSSCPLCIQIPHTHAHTAHKYITYTQTHYPPHTHTHQFKVDFNLAWSYSWFIDSL